MKAVETSEGKALISTYQSALTGARKRWRRLHPEAEAWMLLFGDINIATTDEAKAQYFDLKRAHGIVITGVDQGLSVIPAPTNP